MSEFSSRKAFWLFYFFLIILALGYGYIGAQPAQKESIMFYVGILGIPSLIYVFFDWVTSGRELEEVDTITVEEGHESLEWFSPKLQILVGFIIGALVFYKISITGSAFIDAPKWTIFDSPVGNAIFSALIGSIEDLTFFGILFPTALSIFHKYSDSLALAFLIAMVLSIVGWLSYHNWRYGFSETAMLSVTIFGLIGVLTTYASMSLIIIDLIHGSNNLAIGLGLVKKIALAFIL